MNFFEEIKTAVKVVLLQDEAIKKVSHSKNSTLVAGLIIFISFLIQTFGIYFNSDEKFLSILKLAVSSFLVSFSLLLILHAIALRMKGQAKFKHFFRAIGRGYILGWLAFIPILSLISFWQIIVIYKSLVVVHKISKKQAILGMVISIFLFLFLTYFFEKLSGKTVFWK